MTSAPKQPHHVVIVGAGFGGLETAFGLSGAPVRITLIDRRNHHLFQPLLYQVATASLATSEIAWPVRYLLRGRPEVTTLFATVTGVDAQAKRVLLDDGEALSYDTLVLATGARHAYFGHDEWEPFAPGLKTLEDATTLRRRILAGFADDLSAYAQSSLESIDVQVMLGQPVTECSADGVVFGGTRLEAKTIIWAAGVRASPAAEWLGAPADRAGRLCVAPDLTVPGHPEIFAIGDTVTISAWNGQPVPGIAPAAKQQGRYVAQIIKARLGGATTAPFRYKHAGSLAQIGKRLAVIDFGRIKLRGAIAWWIWGIAHIYFLIGMRHRLSVALSWLWIYVRDQRTARLITQGSSKVAR